MMDRVFLLLIAYMSFDLKLSVRQDSQNVSPQQKKLNRLIEQIEQQKIQLAAWQKAQTEIQQQAAKTLVSIYTELHEVLFQQLEQLWNGLQHYEFSKAEVVQLDDKIKNLARSLKNAQVLSERKKLKIIQIDHFYQQHTEHKQAKKHKKKTKVESHDLMESDQQNLESEQAEIDLDGYDYDTQQHELDRDQHRLNRQKQKREQAQKMAEQSLKTVYLKIASMIHPDREPDEAKKLDKTELLQKVNEAYAEQDLFYLLKLQLQLETNKGLSSKALSSEQVRFYQLALEAQSQNLQSQLEEIFASFHLSNHTNTKQLKMSDVYKVIDKDAAELKQQLKWEKERLKHMKKVSGVEMLLGHGVL